MLLSFLLLPLPLLTAIATAQTVGFVQAPSLATIEAPLCALNIVCICGQRVSVGGPLCVASVGLTASVGGQAKWRAVSLSREGAVDATRQVEEGRPVEIVVDKLLALHQSLTYLYRTKYIWYRLPSKEDLRRRENEESKEAEEDERGGCEFEKRRRTKGWKYS